MNGHQIRHCVDVLGPCRVLYVEMGNKSALPLIDLLLAGCDAWATGNITLQHPRWLPLEIPSNETPEPAAPFDAVILNLPAGVNIRR